MKYRAINLIKRAATVTTLCLIAVNIPTVAQASEDSSSGHDQMLPSISPMPQSIKATKESFPLTSEVGIVTGTKSDPSAVQVVREILQAAGVKRIEQYSDSDPVPKTPVIINIGGPSEDKVSSSVLKSLGVQGPEQLPAEGYVLASGRGSNGKVEIVLSGVDTSGTFYAAQTFRQIVQSDDKHKIIPGVEIRDWPTMKNRGVIEGFYGPPWSAQDRLSQIDFYGAHKMNTYVYAPKDDPYHRDKWRDPYPADQLQQLGQLVNEANKQHVNFVFAVSPGVSVHYSDENDFQALVKKDQALWDLGVRNFAIFFDDINSNLNYQDDQDKFGSDASPSAAAQAYLLNRFENEFISTHPGAHLITVPTDYWQSGHTTYRDRFATLVNKDITVFWTGIGVVAPTITAKDAEDTKSIFQHDLLIWDNYPVNDYATNRLFLGPLVGRDKDLTGHGIVGLTANPMIQAEASKIPLFTVADYTWNSSAYNPERSWNQSLKEFGGSAYDALLHFTENTRSSSLQSKESPDLQPLMDKFWTAYTTANTELLHTASSNLLNELNILQQTPIELRQKLNNPEFLQEVDPWLNKLSADAVAASDAVKMLLAQKENDLKATWRDRLKFENDMKQVSAIQQQMSVGVMDQFLQRAQSENNGLLGIVTPLSSMGSYSNYTLNKMIDGDPSSFYWTNQAVNSGDYVGVDLGSTQDINNIDILMGSTSGPAPRPTDYIHNGAVQVSSDGVNWTTVASSKEQAEIHVQVSAGTKARYIRLLSTASQYDWAQIREFEVNGYLRHVSDVVGDPQAASTSSLSNLADGDLSTAYIAAGIPNTGDALTVKLNELQNSNTITVLQDPNKPVDAQLQVELSDGTWKTIGNLDGGLTQLTVGTQIQSLRLNWIPGKNIPTIYEVIIH